MFHLPGTDSIQQNLLGIRVGQIQIQWSDLWAVHSAAVHSDRADFLVIEGVTESPGPATQFQHNGERGLEVLKGCLLYTSPSPRD